MRNEAKKLAVDEIMNIYKNRPKKIELIVDALGQVGGKDAIEAILSIFKENPHKRDMIIHALGKAGKNS